jgi:hypothetical protein
MVLDAGERLLKNTNAANQANVLAAPYYTIFSQIFVQIIFYVGHSEKAELYKARDKAS